jgi:hypothetical protein
MRSSVAHPLRASVEWLRTSVRKPTQLRRAGGRRRRQGSSEEQEATWLFVKNNSGVFCKILIPKKGVFAKYQIAINIHDPRQGGICKTIGLRLLIAIQNRGSFANFRDKL